MRRTVFVICDTSVPQNKSCFLTHNGKFWTSNLEEAAIWFNRAEAQAYIKKFITNIFHSQIEAINMEGINRFTAVKYRTVYENYFRLKQTIKPLKISEEEQK